MLYVSACKKDNTNSSYVAKPVVQGYLVAGQHISVYIKKESCDRFNRYDYSDYR